MLDMAAPINAEVIGLLLQELMQGGAVSCDLQAWRARGFSLTFCAEDDLPAQACPVAETDRHQVFLVAASRHCATLTQDYTQAVGIVVATLQE